jgi:excisionase family DNA binding protein
MSPPGAEPPPGADVITAAEVASMLRMTKGWVYTETRRNRIPHLRMGRCFRYRRATIEAWLDAKEEGPIPELMPPGGRHPLTVPIPARPGEQRRRGPAA